MKKILSIFTMLFAVSSCALEPATAAGPDSWGNLTIRDAVGIYNSLLVVTRPFNTVCKDGANEKQCEKRYSFKAAVIRSLATDMTALKPISERYTDHNNELIKLYADGGQRVPDDKVSQFLQDQTEYINKTVKEAMGVELHLACVDLDDLKLEDNPEFPIVAISEMATILVQEGCKERK